MNNLNLTSMDDGKMLPLAEDFYTIQGEGFHVGKPAYFIRLGGCDVGCRWCDAKMTWNAKKFPPVAVEEIVARAASFPAQAVVVTGGEPLSYNLNPLSNLLKAQGLQTFLETSGAHPLSGVWDWICLSPKPKQPPLPEIFAKANELKVVVEDERDLRWAEENAAKVAGSCLLFLQPEWTRHRQAVATIVEYAKQRPRWSISIQAHKFMNVP
ncbi:MAG: 7-carboxy-7-deazaguanine synthase QueE [Prevotellaceae bacterium]|jgi:organic radical activating enzyme|nr:7-carboxy-7-deazaguanine synthase QueE [Prevotellaceae bacterium]